LRDTVEQIEKKVVEVIANLLHLDKSKIKPDSLLVEDLGMDSFSAVEMLFRFEDQYGLEISDEEMVNLKKVKDIVAYLDDIIPKN
jgi:acyl carrier protein